MIADTSFLLPSNWTGSWKFSLLNDCEPFLHCFCSGLSSLCYVLSTMYCCQCRLWAEIASYFHFLVSAGILQDVWSSCRPWNRGLNSSWFRVSPQIGSAIFQFTLICKGEIRQILSSDSCSRWREPLQRKLYQMLHILQRLAEKLGQQGV